MLFLLLLICCCYCQALCKLSWYAEEKTHPKRKCPFLRTASCSSAQNVHIVRLIIQPPKKVRLQNHARKVSTSLLRFLPSTLHYHKLKYLTRKMKINCGPLLCLRVNVFLFSFFFPRFRLKRGASFIHKSLVFINNSHSSHK